MQIHVCWIAEIETQHWMTFLRAAQVRLATYSFCNLAHNVHKAPDWAGKHCIRTKQQDTKHMLFAARTIETTTRPHARSQQVHRLPRSPTRSCLKCIIMLPQQPAYATGTLTLDAADPTRCKAQLLGRI